MNSDWALDVMRRAPYITVSFTRPDGTAYGVPLSLASTDDDTWYFHCALAGDKLDAIARHPEVCLSAVARCRPMVGPKDNSFTLAYESAMAFGRAELVTDPRGEDKGTESHQRTVPAPAHGCFRFRHRPQSFPHGSSPRHSFCSSYRQAQAV